MLNEYLGQLNDFMYTYILIFLLIGSGVYFTIRTRFVQVRRIGDVLRILKEKSDNSEGGSRFRLFRLS